MCRKGLEFEEICIRVPHEQDLIPRMCARYSDALHRVIQCLDNTVVVWKMREDEVCIVVHWSGKATDKRRKTTHPNADIAFTFLEQRANTWPIPVAQVLGAYEFWEGNVRLLLKRVSF